MKYWLKQFQFQTGSIKSTETTPKKRKKRGFNSKLVRLKERLLTTQTKS